MFIEEKYNLHSKFNLEMHKKTYIAYLEVLILEDGSVEYAVPSHQVKAEELCCRKLGISRQELIDSCPQEYYCDYMTWLLNQCNAVAVWFENFVGNPNKKQRNMLKRFKMSGIYCGPIYHRGESHNHSLI